MKDFKDTLNLPKTSFKMKANLAQKEPLRVRQWQKEGYKLQNNTRVSTYVLHDGPPYANGKLHIGHVLNKTLKDIVGKSKLLDGNKVHFAPGWDCHGLPIELKVEDEVKQEIPAKSFREKCRKYAVKQIKIQQEDFQRLGVWANWDEPYYTMDFENESVIVESLYNLLDKGYIKKGNKPVYWCFDCQSSLADAEVEYAPKTSTSMYVKFPFSHPKYKNISALAWTTTPWSLPANQALAVHEDVKYSIVQYENEHLVIATKLIDSIQEQTGFDLKIVDSILATELCEHTFEHPFFDKQVLCMFGSHVTIDAGTGLVHTAPSHGLEDFQLWDQSKEKILSLINGDGTFNDENVKELQNVHAFKATGVIAELLKQQNKLFFSAKLEHSYPHCWRHKTPVIYRATPQWFVNLEHNNLREKAIDAAKASNFVPKSGFERISKMIEQRNDWCISRQFRRWGVPMCLVLSKQDHSLHPEQLEFMPTIIKAIKAKGIQAWHDIDLAQLGVDSASFYKSQDTLDVWFCSGVSHTYVVKKRGFEQADIYLEGSDQHRGWFQSSLLTSVAMYGKAPFKTVLTHGFTVDKNGKKMSKSLGNIIEPDTLFQKYGADVVRLWVLSTDYQKEVTISDEILTRTTDAYRRIRNTIRYLLANTSDFTKADLLDPKELLDIDKYILQKAHNLQEHIIDHYQSFDFHQIYHKVLNFCVVDLGNFYLDVIKDRQYTFHAKSKQRLASQTAMYHILQALIRWLTPVLSFTVEEVREKLDLPGNMLDYTWYDLPKVAPNMPWIQILDLKEKIQKSLEESRNSGAIKSNLAAKVDLAVTSDLYDILHKYEADLASLLIVSIVKVTKADKLSITVTPSLLEKCPRCWMHVGVLMPQGVCQRCDDNLNQRHIIRTIA